MPHWPVILGRGKLEPGTGRVLALLERLANPHHRLPPVIHVAGTNGKGSTLAFMRAVLEAAGYRVHRYTSPHLKRFNERILLAGEEVSDGMLFAALEECRHAASDVPLTFFEGTTVAALLLFSRVPADIVLIETGMGGRLDATNIIEQPAVTVITPISLDHQEYLGPDIGVIAGEKAGIARQNVPFVVAPQWQGAMEVLSVMAYKQGAPLFRYGYEWNVAAEEEGFRFVSEPREIAFPLPNLAGNHQVTNAATAIAALSQLQGFSLPDSAFRKGITHAIWPARLQRLDINGLPEGWEVWLDGAHNAGGAAVLRQWVDDTASKPLYLIFGTTKGKDAVGFFRAFAGRVEKVYGVQVQSEPGSYSASSIVSMAAKAGLRAVAAGNLHTALEDIAQTERQPGLVLICGSLFLAGDV